MFKIAEFCMAMVGILFLINISVITFAFAYGLFTGALPCN